MKKKLLSSVAFAIGLNSFLFAQFTTRWEKSYTTFETAPIGFKWLTTVNGDRASSLAYNKTTNHLLVTQRGVGGPSGTVNPGIIVLDATTGDSLTALNVTGIPAITFGGNANFQKVRIDDNGVIYAVSLCVTNASNTPTNTAILRVLRWADETSAPTECARFNVNERIGDGFGLSGTGTNTILYVNGNQATGGTSSPNFTGSIYALTTTDGITFNTINTITVPLGSSSNNWSAGGVTPVTNSLTSDLWMDGVAMPARRVAISGTAPNFTGTSAYTTVNGTSSGQFPNVLTQIGYLSTSSGNRFIAGCGGFSTNSASFKMLNITNESTPVDFISDNLLNPNNYQNGAGTGDIAFKLNANGTYDIFYLSSNIGLKCITTTAVLPVSLTDFKVSLNNKVAQLNWTTLSETNNKGFEIQKSTDGINFKTIGFVESKASLGISSDRLQYFFEDKNTIEGQSYYRIKQIDKDGKFTLSAIKLVEINSNSSFDVQLLQNPSRGNIQLNVKSNVDCNVNVSVVSPLGTSIFRKVFHTTVGENRLDLNINNLPKGVFFVQVFVPDMNWVKKLKVIYQ